MRQTLVPILIMFAMIIPALPSTDADNPQVHLSTGKDLYVGGSGEGNYTRIQDAIDNATDGDRLHIAAGAYKETLSVNKSVEIEGVGNATILDFFPNKIGVHITKLVSVRNMSVEGSGMGFLLEDARSSTISNCDITNCATGIWVDRMNKGSIADNRIDAASGIIFENVVESNVSGNTFVGYTQSVGLCLDNSSGNTIDGNDFTPGNFGMTAIEISNGSSKNEVRNNLIMNYNRGITIFESRQNKPSDNLVTGVELSCLTGIMVNDAYNLSIDGCTFKEWMGPFDNCDGIWAQYWYSGNVTNCTFNGFQHGINASNSRNVYVKDSLFRNISNEAISLGMGYSSSRFINVTGNTFYFNNGAGPIFDVSHVQGADGLLKFTNYWHGNYWSDWTGPDGDGDGIVDAPYAPSIINDTSPLADPTWTFSDAPVIATDNVVDAYKLTFYNVSYWAYDIDTPGSGLHWSFSTDSDWLSFSPDQVLSGTPSQIGECWVNITVSDGEFDLAWTNFTITIHGENYAPVITTKNVVTCLEDSPYTVDYSATDVDPIQWALFTDASFLSMDVDDGVLSGTPSNDDVGTYAVAITATDGLASSSTTFDLTVYNLNDDPVIGNTTEYVLQEDESMATTIHVIDPDPTKDALSWTVLDMPDFIAMSHSQEGYGMGVKGNLYLSGTPGNGDVGVHSIILKAIDGKGGLDTATLNFTVRNVNDPPSIVTADTTSGDRNRRYEVDYEAIDVDPTRDVLTWAVSTNATFLSMNSSSGMLSGTPTNDDIGQYRVDISVQDGKGGIDWSNFTLTISRNNKAPGSTGNVPTFKAKEDSTGVLIDLRMLFKDPDGDEITYEVFPDPGLDAYIDVDGILHIIPNSNWAGLAYVTVIASDGLSSFTIKVPVNVENVNDPPMILKIDVPSKVVEGDLIILKANSTDPDLEYGDSLSYEWNAVGRGVLGRDSEVRIRLNAGTYDIGLRVSDVSGAVVKMNTTLIVGAGPHEDDGRSYEWVAMVIVAGIVITIGMSIGIVLHLKNRPYRDEWVIAQDDRPRQRRHGRSRGDLWSALESDPDPDIGEIYRAAVSSDVRSRAPHLKDMVNTMYSDDELDADQYGDLMEVLDRIGE